MTCSITIAISAPLILIFLIKGGFGVKEHIDSSLVFMLDNVGVVIMVANDLS